MYGTEYDDPNAPPIRVPAAAWFILALVVLMALGVVTRWFGVPWPAPLEWAAQNVIGMGPAAGFAADLPAPTAIAGRAPRDRSPAGAGDPALLMFTADWCVPCHRFRERVLVVPAVQSRMYNSVRFEKVDLTHPGGPNAERAKKYDVTGIPALVLVNSRGREISRYNGPPDADEFLKWLDKHVK
jgi:hypothetical protein